MAKMNLTAKTLALIGITLVAAIAGCKGRGEGTTPAPSGPKTSFGKAVQSAKSLSRAEDERNRRMKEQAAKAFE